MRDQQAPNGTTRGRSMRAAAATALAALTLACATTRAPTRLAEIEAAARQAIAREQSLAAQVPLGDRTVGVAPLAASGDSTTVWLAYGLADLLMTDLARSARVEVVDRLQMHAFLRELDLAEAGRVDSTRAPRVGRLLGARQLVLGEVGQEPARLRVHARVADVATTEVRGSISVGATIDDILAAEKELVLALFDQLGVDLTPAERAAVEQRPTRNLAALLAYSRGVRHEVYGRYDLAVEEFGRALDLDPSFDQADVRRRDAGAIGGVEATGSPAGTRQAFQRESLQRAGAAVVSGVNPTMIRPVGGAADPAFAGSRTVTLIITVTNRP